MLLVIVTNVKIQTTMDNHGMELEVLRSALVFNTSSASLIKNLLILYSEVSSLFYVRSALHFPSIGMMITCPISTGKSTFSLANKHFNDTAENLSMKKFKQH